MLGGRSFENLRVDMRESGHRCLMSLELKREGKNGGRNSFHWESLFAKEPLSFILIQSLNSTPCLTRHFRAFSTPTRFIPHDAMDPTSLPSTPPPRESRTPAFKDLSLILLVLHGTFDGLGIGAVGGGGRWGRRGCWDVNGGLE